MKINKIIMFTMAIFTISFFSNTKLIHAAEVVSPQVYYFDSKLEVRADIIDWRYKLENNKLYRRQYNYTKQEWIGKWELL